MTFNFKSIAAFTLAEILITLAIIGVIAAITIPNLIAKYEQEVNIAKLKKIYKELSDINEKLNYEYGGTWLDQCSNFNDICFKNMFKPYLKVKKECTSDAPSDCQAASQYLNQTDTQVHWKSCNTDINMGWQTVLAETYILKFRFHGTSDKHSLPNNGWIQVDVNGRQKPNTAGKDIYWFWLQDEHLSTVGNKSTSALNEQFIEQNCKYGNGHTCAAYYLLENKR